MIRHAAPSDQEGRALWDLIRSDFYANQRASVESLDRNGSLATDLDVDRATDLLCTLNHPDLWHDGGVFGTRVECAWVLLALQYERLDGTVIGSRSSNALPPASSSP